MPLGDLPFALSNFDGLEEICCVFYVPIFPVVVMPMFEMATGCFSDIFSLVFMDYFKSRTIQLSSVEGVAITKKSASLAVF